MVEGGPELHNWAHQDQLTGSARPKKLGGARHRNQESYRARPSHRSGRLGIHVCLISVQTYTKARILLGGRRGEM